mmetsp:Transcript_4592/g.12777  ORF Transcript_4592/g.12777 Transcript_4592/m.12777 type:complete len:526 (+) Transcript_4592:190-1767(+)
MGNCFSGEDKKGKEAVYKASPEAAQETSAAAGSAGTAAAKAAGTPVKPSSKSTNLILEKETEDVQELYEIGKVLGRGQFGTARLATEKATGVKYACKTISKRKLRNKDDIEDVKREIQIMHHLAGHPNIVTMKDTFEDKNNIHLITELCAGGELFDRITARGHYSEKDAATLVRTMVSVVAHCHHMGVMHRDLKPENFLMADETEAAELKATDFGLSVYLQSDKNLTELVGSAFYVAPEVLRRHYYKEADIWSCGVILYILLSGVPPFYGETEQQIFEAILRGRLDLQSDPWPQITPAAKDCVKKMLVQDPKQRATADQILQHEWMRVNGVASDKPLDNAIATRIKKFANLNKLKKEAMKVMAKNIAPDEVTGLREVFKNIDKDSSGTITVEEMREAMKEQGNAAVEAEMMALIEGADLDGDGVIDYEEFLAATVQLNKLNKEENLRAAFEHFDADNSGYITREELQSSLSKVEGLSSEQVEVILQDVDKDNDGKIDYEEFCQMMLKDDDQKPVRGGLNFPGEAS